MDQPTAEHALRQLEPLVGEWTLEARWPSGEPWPGGGRVTFEWHASGAHLVQKAMAELPEAPDNISVIGCDGASQRHLHPAVLGRARRLPHLRDEHRQRRVEALARG